MRRGLVPCFVLIVFYLTAMNAAAVPTSISYQGRLTENDVPVADATYSVTFRIYEVAGGGSTVWSEVQSVTTAEGLFTVLLGAVTPMYPDLFEGPTKYLTMQVGGEAESSPRIPMVSVPYAMTAGSLEGGSTTDCHDCDTIFINSVGPEILTATSRTAFSVLNSGVEAREGFIASIEGQSVDSVSALVGSAVNFSTGVANGGSFSAFTGSTGPVNGLYSIAMTPTSAQPAIGVYGVGKNFGTGIAKGGHFSVPTGGSGDHIGVYAESYASNSAPCFGIRTLSRNEGAGTSYGGLFQVPGYSTSLCYGVFGDATAQSSDDAIGAHGQAQNTGFGRAIGGDFAAASGGSGSHYGVYSASYANTDSLSVGVRGIGSNFGSGGSYGGVFQAEDQGTGLHAGIHAAATGRNNSTWGAYGYAGSSGSGSARGFYGYAQGSGSGWTNGGYFYCHTSGTGEGHGSVSYSDGVAGVPLIAGTTAEAYGYSGFSGTVYGGNFTAGGTSSAGTQYGVYGYSWANGSYSSYGVNGRSEHFGSGSSYGGYFLADSSGTGASYGIRPVALTRGSAAAYGVRSAVANRGTGSVYGGYFEVLNYGTGTRYAVYGTSSGSGYAGYFSGNVRVTGSQTVLGTKSAAVKMADGAYRQVYCQESPEVWFEDFGEGQLVSGKAHIELDDLFLQAVTIDQASPMKVFIQLNDPECNGTAVVRGLTGFDVVELMNGRGNATFSYRVVAKRRGYEQVRLDVMAGPSPEEVEAEIERDRVTLQADEEEAARDYQKQQESRQRRQAEREEELASPTHIPK